jgi:hypothetical protein
MLSSIMIMVSSSGSHAALQTTYTDDMTPPAGTSGRLPRKPKYETPLGSKNTGVALPPDAATFSLGHHARTEPETQMTDARHGVKPG